MAVNLHAQTSITNETGLYQAISAKDDDLLIQGGFALNNTVNISNYPSHLFMRAASVPTSFSGNSSTMVFDVSGSSVSFENIGFKNMQGNVFIKSENSTLNFENAAFENNDSGYDYSAFVFNEGSKVNFSGETVFAFNKGFYGGGFYAEGVEMEFNGKTVFENNQSMSAGGGFVSQWSLNTLERSVINFNDEVIFASNTASLSGGAFFATTSDINFNNSATFQNNKSGSEGGAALISGASVNFNGFTLFEKNQASGNGGALAVNTDILYTVNLSAVSEFKENEAGGAGGAIYVKESVVTLQNASFTNNKAAAGGAVFLVGDADYESYAQLNINTVNNGATDNKTVFQGNTAGGVSNALHLAEYSSVTFITASGAAVEMYDGIKSGTDTAFMIVSGAGNFNLYADADIYNLDLKSGVFNLSASNKLDVVNLNADKDSVLNMKNSSVSNVINVKNFNFNGTLKVDGGEEDNSGDKIVAENVFLGADSKLDIQTDAAVTAEKNYRKRYYKTLEYAVRVGSFSAITLNDGLSLSALSIGSEVFYGDNWLTVSLTGNDISTKFSKISGLSYNQLQVAETFDKISSSQTISADLDERIAEIDAFGTDDIKKSALFDVSGYFLANVIRSAAVGSEKQEIYNRIRYQDMNAHNLCGIWAQARAQSSEIYEDENSRNKYKDYAAGALAGWDMMFDKSGFLLGIYGKYDKHEIKQDLRNEATLEESGGGIYAGVLKDDWEIKTLISASADNFVTSRYVTFANRTAKAEFSAVTVAADFEGAIRAYVTEDILFRPFVGIEFKNTAYESFTEKNAGDLSLNVNDGNYSRSSARIGLGIGSDEDVTFEWYAAVEGKYLLTPETPEITSSFIAAPETFKSKGAREGSTIIGLGAGASYRLFNIFKIFMSASYQYADGYQNIYGTAGLRCMFGSL
jgi:predicted outer membrane repeat protein